MIATLFILGAVTAFDNPLPAMYGSVDGPGSGLSQQTGVAFYVEGTDLDDQGAVSRMLHEPEVNSQPTDDLAVGWLEASGLVASNSNTGWKKWRCLYTLIEVPADTTYYKFFTATLHDTEVDSSTWNDESVAYSWPFPIHGPVSGGGGGGGGGGN